MRDLVRQHARQLRKVVRPLDQAPVHVHEPARHGERVDFLAVDDEESPVLNVGARRQPRDRIAQ